MPVLFAVTAALGWGAADFFGGASRRNVPVFGVLAVSQGIAVLAIAPVLLARGGAFPGDPRLLYAGVAGLGATVELHLVYLAISRGDAFITVPVGALGATAAVVTGLAGGERLSPALAAGLVCAIAGGGLSAWLAPVGRRGGGGASRNAPLCLGAAAGLGLALSCLHAAARVDPYWAVAVLSASTAVPALFAVILLGRRRPVERSCPPSARCPHSLSSPLPARSETSPTPSPPSMDHSRSSRRSPRSIH